MNSCFRLILFGACLVACADHSSQDAKSTAPASLATAAPVETGQAEVAQETSVPDKRAETARPAKSEVESEATNTGEVEALPLEIPPINTTPTTGKIMRKARSHHRSGLKRLKKKDHAGAVVSFKASLAIDPGDLDVRYDLALAYLKLEDGRALSILDQFKKAGDPFSVSQLVRARSDERWKSQWDKAGFRAHTESAKVEQPSLPTAAIAFRQAFLSGQYGDSVLARVIRPRAAVEVEVSGQTCVHGGAGYGKGACDWDPGEIERGTGIRGVKWKLGRETSERTIGKAKVPKCDAPTEHEFCCDFGRPDFGFDPDTGPERDGVREICFKRGEGEAVHLVRVRVQTWQ